MTPPNQSPKNKFPYIRKKEARAHSFFDWAIFRFFSKRKMSDRRQLYDSIQRVELCHRFEPITNSCIRRMPLGDKMVTSSRLYGSREMYRSSTRFHLQRKKTFLRAREKHHCRDMPLRCVISSPRLEGQLAVLLPTRRVLRGLEEGRRPDANV